MLTEQELEELYAAHNHAVEVNDLVEANRITGLIVDGMPPYEPFMEIEGPLSMDVLQELFHPEIARAVFTFLSRGVADYESLDKFMKRVDERIGH